MSDVFVSVENRRIPLSELETIRVLASYAGFDEVDVEPTGEGNSLRVTATRWVGDEAIRLRVTGANAEECREKFAARVLT